MHGDFTRNTFDATKHLSRVLMQQGRVQLDADFNEQTAITLQRLRLLGRDIIGRHAAPADIPDSFKITPAQSGGEYVFNDLQIAPGRYYVEGLLCENDAQVQYMTQPSFPIAPKDDVMALLDGKSYVVYLDAWERHLTYVIDRGFKEVALGGPDTCSRAMVVWQVRAIEVTAQEIQKDKIGENLLDKKLQSLSLDPAHDPTLKARAQVDTTPTDACIIPPGMQYRGAENQLYRVEVHTPGLATDQAAGSTGVATFKWSRENGSVIFPIEEPSGSVVTVTSLGRDECSGLRVGDWVEVVDDAYELRGRASNLLQVKQIQTGDRRVTLSDNVPTDVGANPALHPYLRRWDQKAGVGKDGTIPIVAKADGWIDLEDGIQVQFSGGTGTYRTGDYWMIPARTATGDVEWPGEPGNPQWAGPHGVKHYYAPLAVLSLDANGVPTIGAGFRRTLNAIWTLAT